MNLRPKLPAVSSKLSLWTQCPLVLQRQWQPNTENRWLWHGLQTTYRYEFSAQTVII